MADLDKLFPITGADPDERPATWTHEVVKTSLRGIKGQANIYHFTPSEVLAPPWSDKRRVEAVVYIARDGTLAGLTLTGEGLPPPPPRAK